MKKYLLAIITALLAFSLFTGCATPPNAATMQRIQTAAKLAAYIGTSEYLKVHPETRPAFVMAAQELNSFSASPNVDLPTLLAIVNQLPVKQLKSERSQMFLTATAILLADWGGQLPLDRVDQLKPVASAIEAGIHLGLGN